MENKKPIDKQTSGLGVSKNNLDIEHDCAICSKEFKLEENLRKHIKLNHYFPCRFCSKTFSEIRFLESHSSSTCIGYSNPSILSKLVCRNCRTKITADDLKVHFLTCQAHTGEMGFQTTMGK